MYSEAVSKLLNASGNPAELLMKFNETNPYENVCFLEGSTDKDFFEKVQFPFLEKLAPEYIFPFKDSSIKGKEAVIDVYKRILKQGHQDRRGSVVFIVDRDFFALDDYSDKYQLSESDIGNITVLPVHSHEMYFLSDSNLDSIFTFYKVEKNTQNYFQILLDDESELLIDYYALKATETWMCVHGIHGNKQAPPNRSTEIQTALTFNFSLIDDERPIVEYGRERIQEDIRFMKNKIKVDKGNKDKLKSVNKRIKKQLRNNQLLLQGHTMLNFLAAFLHQICHIDSRDGILDVRGKYNSELLKKIHVDLDVVSLKLLNGDWSQE